MKELKLHYTELFYSVQGEGKWVGQPSIFLRTFGCNFKCEGFGMAKGEKSCERNKVDPDKYDSIEDLPLVKTGCDSYASWDPRFKKFKKRATATELIDEMEKLIPGGKWQHDTDVHLILTGGEPLLGWQKIYPDLFDRLADRGLKNITFESNGTQFLQESMLEWLSAQNRIHITWSISPKLSISGHTWEEAIRPLVLKQYSEQPNSDLFIKCVVGNLDDFEELKTAAATYREAGVKLAHVFAMPVGGTVEGLEMTERQVADLCLEHGIRFSPRLHVNIYGNAWAK